MSLEIFSKNLRHLMIEHGWTNERLAMEVTIHGRKVTARAVDIWRQGRGYPSIETLIALCEVLQFLDIHTLLTQDITTVESVITRRNMKRGVLMALQKATEYVMKGG